MLLLILKSLQAYCLTPRSCTQAALVYAEVLLIVQYSYLCLVRCVCEAPSSANEGEVSPGIWSEVGCRLY